MATSDPTQGQINTSFLTTKLPQWAGVRQNVLGSDLNGRPVPAYNPPEEVKAAGILGTALSADVPVTPKLIPQEHSAHVWDHAAAIAGAIEDLKVSLRGIVTRVGVLEGRTNELSGNLETVRDVKIVLFDQALKNISTRLSAIMNKMAAFEARLTDLEDAVEEMEEDDDSEASPSAPSTAPENHPLPPSRENSTERVPEEVVRGDGIAAETQMH